MTGLPEISVIHSAHAGDAESGSTAPASTWAPVELPRVQRPTPTTLIMLAVCAGVGALTLGVLAGVLTLRGGEEPPLAAPASASVESTDQRALALLAKPSTERIAFQGSGGSLVLAVGSGGRAAILVRGFERATAARPYAAWVVGSGQAIPAARVDGTDRVVFLDVSLAPYESVVIARKRPGRLTSGMRLVASRD